MLNIDSTCRGKKTAGIDWLTGFLHSHPTLSVRVAEATSMQRTVGFNEAEVKRFFDELKRQASPL